ncbi:uncharacterized protein LOC143031438 [Oratosquilla oratoria]|uniref:uncharacterized protein LOC143031438 n=1 Tax=Oratosquilla oratoria TaxID=337810 RepID=UPI003F768C2D
MADTETTLADVIRAMAEQGRTQHAELQAMVNHALSEQGKAQQAEIQAVANRVDSVFKQVFGLVKEECSRVKGEVLKAVFTKDEVKGEVEKVASDLRRYVDEVVAAQVPPALFRHEDTLPRESEQASEAEDSDEDEANSRHERLKSRSPLAKAFPSPPGAPANVLSPPPSPPASVKSGLSAASSTSRRLGSGTRRRPQEFDGTVSWEAYKTQFELLASAHQWSRPEMAMQLVWALKGPALEVLNQLPATQRSSYSKVTATLERRYGHQHQTEVFRTRFRARVRGPGETLTRLAQDLEVLVRRAYPEASEEMITILLRDQFVDAIDNQQLRIYVQQAHPKDLQEALARGLEMESFLWITRERPSWNSDSYKVRAKKGKVDKSPSRPASPSGEFWGKCYSCGQQGHSKKYCPQGTHGGKAVGAGAGPHRYKPCCWSCGEGYKTAGCAIVSDEDSKKVAGNWEGLAEGVEYQPEDGRPQSV